MRAFLSQFLDSHIREQALARVAIQWWISLLQADWCPTGTLEQCMITPTQRMAWRTTAGLIKGIDVAEPEKRAAILWACFLLDVYLASMALTGTAWSAIKDCCRRLLSKEEGQEERVLFQRLPRAFTETLSQRRDMSDHQKLTAWVQVPMAFPEHDRTRFEAVTSRLTPDFVM